MELFPQQAKPNSLAGVPLAERLRPKSFADFFGQQELVGKQSLLRQMVERGELSSIILWGPPGCGKTTLAHLMASLLQWHFVPLSAVMSGVKELRSVMQEAEKWRSMSGKRTILFIDEIHRFNKAQQDALLPYVEKGSVVLVGATTENPSFEVISALLSRCRVFQLQALSVDDIVKILQRAQDKDSQLRDAGFHLSDAALQQIAEHSGGDSRCALNVVEFMAASGMATAGKGETLSSKEIKQAIKQAVIYHDKAGAQHYDTISALHKSMRNSDVDAALYWLGRMLEAGDDPLYVARRLIRFASEDIGLADNRALTLALHAKEAVHFVGMPEGALALAQAVVFLSLAPKNNSVYTAYGRVRRDLQAGEIYPVPTHLRNAVTKLDKEFGFGQGYRLAHDFAAGVADMPCLPEPLAKRANGGYYRPKRIGSEKDLVEAWEKRRKHINKGESEHEE